MKKKTLKEFILEKLKNGELGDTPQADFAGDVKNDKAFRDFKTWEELHNYLSFHGGCREAIKVAKGFFQKWEKSEAASPTKKRGKAPPTDGLGPREVAKIRSALRQVWHRSHARKLCAQRALGKDGYHYCEQCKKRTPQIKIDHIVKCGLVDDGYIQRLFVPSKGLQALCPQCHNTKSRIEKMKDF